MTRTNPARLLAGSIATLVALGLAPAAAAASPPRGPNAVQTTEFRRLVGAVSAPTYFELSVPEDGAYVLEYEITGVAFFDTYVDETELGYVGGPDGSYRTRSITLTAGGHLVQAVGPEGSGSARLYLVRS